MDQIHDRVAGLDVHRDSVTACVRRIGPNGGVAREKEQLITTTAGLEVLGGWLAGRQVELVAMGATGVCWKPVVRWSAAVSPCGCATPATSRRFRAARPTCRMPSGSPTSLPMGWFVRASCHHHRSENFGS